MEKEDHLNIKEFKRNFLNLIENKPVQIISHFDTDGITSASIIIQVLTRLDKQFSLKIVKRLEKGFTKKLDPSKVTLFLDLASNSFEEIKDSSL
jgi:single-stranded DNA-specific DHH superfamily exonuclease